MTVSFNQAAKIVHQDNHFNQQGDEASIDVPALRQFLLDIVAQGVTSLNGAQGAQGSQGSQGAGGAAGAQGATGRAGAQGAQGAAP